MCIFYEDDSSQTASLKLYMKNKNNNKNNPRPLGSRYDKTTAAATRASIAELCVLAFGPPPAVTGPDQFKPK